VSLIDQTSLLRIADRAAMQYYFIYEAFAQLVLPGGDYYADIVTATNDNDVEIPLQTNYNYVDTSLNVSFNVANGTPLASILGSMLVHFNIRDLAGDVLQVGGWDGYLYEHDCRASYYFALLFRAIYGQYMLAVNIFSESDDEFGTVDIIAGPTVSFTDGINYGNGAITNPANGTYYAATQLKIVVVVMGANAVDLRLSVKDVSDNPVTIDVSISGGQSPGAEISVGTTADRFLDVMDVDFVLSGNTGTVGDQFTINNLKERQISL
jgi:hypothetical protein